MFTTMTRRNRNRVFLGDDDSHYNQHSQTIYKNIVLFFRVKIFLQILFPKKTTGNEFINVLMNLTEKEREE